MRRPAPLATVAVLAVLAAATAATAAPQFTATSVSPTGWNPTDRALVGWTVVSDHLSPGSIRLEISTADDGSADAGWIPLWSRPFLRDGSDQIEVALGGMEGRRALRAVAADSSGSSIRYIGTLTLDRTAPRSQRVRLDRSRSSTWITWHQDDNGGSGTTDLTLETEVAPGVWSPTTTPATDGLLTARVDLAGRPDGRYPTRIRATDSAGNTGTTQLPALVVDHAPPTVSGLAMGPRMSSDPSTIQVVFTASDALAGIADGSEMSIIDAVTGMTYTRFAGAAGLNVTAVRFSNPGPHRLAARVTDAVGNVGVGGVLEVSLPSGVFGAPSVNDPREWELVTASLSIDVAGSAAAGRDRTVAVRFGGTVTASGSLRRPDGTPLGATEIEVQDVSGAVRGRTVTRADGTFRLGFTPRRGGPHRIGVPLADDLLPMSAGRIRVRMTPRVTIDASRRVARARGAAVVFTGRIHPSPESLGIATKNVVFEWRDPIRRRWRPMVNTRVRADGTVRTRWAFGAGGFRVPIRLRLTSERGWPTMEGVSRAVTIRVE